MKDHSFDCSGLLLALAYHWLKYIFAQDDCGFVPHLLLLNSVTRGCFTETTIRATTLSVYTFTYVIIILRKKVF